jgi:class 3 adenylate cyclase
VNEREDLMQEHAPTLITMLYTDIEGSTQRWERFPQAMHAVLARHNAILQAAITQYHGKIVVTTGDGVLAVFAVSSDAVHAALAAQRALGAEDWGDVGAIRVRMGLHTGEAVESGGDYHSRALNRGARLMAMAQGGQILLSAATYELARDQLSEGTEVQDLGEHRLRDLIRPEHVYQITAVETRTAVPPSQPSNLAAAEDVQAARSKQRVRRLSVLRALRPTGGSHSHRRLVMGGLGGVLVLVVAGAFLLWHAIQPSSQPVMARTLPADLATLRAALDPLPPLSQPAAGLSYDNNSHHYLSQRFLAFWLKNGSWLRIGHPLSEAFKGKDGYTQQFFERALVEDTPQGFHYAPLGIWITLGRQFPAAAPVLNTPSRRYFPSTQQLLTEPFLSFWSKYDPPADPRLGRPISGVLLEHTPDVANLLVHLQYFENGWLEWHPEFKGTKQAGFLYTIGDAGRAYLEQLHLME